MGVAIGRLPLIEDFIRSGALVEPFSLRITSRNAYWLLAAANTAPSPEAIRFRTWMLKELGRETPTPAALAV
jgi:LysR family glycine cleavage system transcriptional activator